MKLRYSIFLLYYRVLFVTLILLMIAAVGLIEFSNFLIQVHRNQKLLSQTADGKMQDNSFGYYIQQNSSYYITEMLKQESKYFQVCVDSRLFV